MGYFKPLTVPPPPEDPNRLLFIKNIEHDLQHWDAIVVRGTGSRLIMKAEYWTETNTRQTLYNQRSITMWKRAKHWNFLRTHGDFDVHQSESEFQRVAFEIQKMFEAYRIMIEVYDDVGKYKA